MTPVRFVLAACAALLALSPARADHGEMFGSADVTGTATALGGGLWRYDYAVTHYAYQQSVDRPDAAHTDYFLVGYLGLQFGHPGLPDPPSHILSLEFP